MEKFILKRISGIHEDDVKPVDLRKVAVALLGMVMTVVAACLLMAALNSVTGI